MIRDAGYRLTSMVTASVIHAQRVDTIQLAGLNEVVRRLLAAGDHATTSPLHCGQPYAQA
jgi:hypothetical protein